jgi:hypothetical protein
MNVMTRSHDERTLFIRLSYVAFLAVVSDKSNEKPFDVFYKEGSHRHLTISIVSSPVFFAPNEFPRKFLGEP